jgi:hypothetical protein
MGNYGCKLSLPVCRDCKVFPAGVTLSVLHDQASPPRPRASPQRNGSFDVETSFGLVLFTKNRSDEFQLPFFIGHLNIITNLKLTRFRGHPNICVQGVHDGEDETTLHT